MVAWGARLAGSEPAKRELAFLRTQLKIVCEQRLCLASLAEAGVGAGDDRLAATIRATEQAWNLLRMRARSLYYGVTVGWCAAEAYFDTLMADALNADGPKKDFDFLQDDKGAREAAKRAQDDEVSRKRKAVEQRQSESKVPATPKPGPRDSRPKWHANYNYTK